MHDFLVGVVSQFVQTDDSFGANQRRVIPLDEKKSYCDLWTFGNNEKEVRTKFYYFRLYDWQDDIYSGLVSDLSQSGQSGDFVLRCTGALNLFGQERDELGFDKRIIRRTEIAVQGTREASSCLSDVDASSVSQLRYGEHGRMEDGTV